VAVQDPISDGPPLIECDLPLGRPGLTAHNDLRLSGWSASPKGIAGVVVQIDERQWNTSYGHDTPAVGQRHPAIEGAGRAGYHLSVDTSGWEPGTYYVTVAAFDREGGRAAVEGQVEVRPFPAQDVEDAGDAAATVVDGPVIRLDAPLDAAAEPCEIEGPVTVSGWAHADEGIEAVLVTVDGTVQYEALRPIARPDLLVDLGREVALSAGFTLQLGALDCPPGAHSLTVAALTRGGRTAGVERELRCRSPLAPQLGAPPVERALEPSAPRLRDGDVELSETDRAWKERALLAEADAAQSRAEAGLARTEQERVRRELRAVELDSGVLLGRLRDELATARMGLASLREELDEAQRPV